MSPSVSTLNRLLIALLLSAFFIGGCSSSSDSQSAVDGNTTGTEDPGEDAGGGDTDGTPDDADGDTTQPDPDEPESSIDDPVNPDPGTSVPDPLTQNTTTVNFHITVPAYVSNALQVRIAWDEMDLTAEWAGDEFWMASAEFPTDSENPLLITFLNDNGDVTLASFEQRFKTGTNESETYTVTADQFDTERWDSDGDGISNINEIDDSADPSDPPRVLLFSETRGYRHDAIADALSALEELAASAGIQSERADDSVGVITDANLATYDAVVWVLTSGDVLSSEEENAFERYIRSGGGYAGIHAASDTEYEWPWYGGLVGAYFNSHPAIQSATQVVEDSSHPSTSHLDSRWTRTDEWYDYHENPRAQVNVLLSLNEDSYSGGKMGEDHPSAWYHDYDGGRSWYTGGGHTVASYAEPEFRAHLLGGLRYAVGFDL